MRKLRYGVILISALPISLVVAAFLSGSQPLRMRAGDVGRYWPGSGTEHRWNPVSGDLASQYVAAVRVETALHIYMPLVLRTMRDDPHCKSVLTSAAAVPRTSPGKFLYSYGIARGVDTGAAYYYTAAQYNWEIPQHLLDTAAGCLRPGPWITPEILELLNKHVQGAVLVDGNSNYKPVAHLRNPSTAQVNSGLLNPSKPGPPLTQEQCTKLFAARDAHHKHANALLAHDPNAANYAPAVISTGLDFEASALNVGQQALFLLIFTGAIDPKRSQASTDALTHETMFFYDQWVDAFKCGTGQPPSVKGVVRGRWGHGRAHFLRAVFIPSLIMREICPGDLHTCPESGT